MLLLKPLSRLKKKISEEGGEGFYKKKSQLRGRGAPLEWGAPK